MSLQKSGTRIISNFIRTLSVALLLAGCALPPELECLGGRPVLKIDGQGQSAAIEAMLPPQILHILSLELEYTRTPAELEFRPIHQQLNSGEWHRPVTVRQRRSNHALELKYRGKSVITITSPDRVSPEWICTNSKGESFINGPLFRR